MPQSQDREQHLVAMKKLLNTPDGLILMEELKAEWDKFMLLGNTPEETGYRVGLRDAFKYLESLQTGDNIDE